MTYTVEQRGVGHDGIHQRELEVVIVEEGASLHIAGFVSWGLGQKIKALLEREALEMKQNVEHKELRQQVRRARSVSRKPDNG